MTDRLAAALAELVDALRAEVRADAAPVGNAPDRLLDVGSAAAMLGGIGRSILYGEIGAGRLRSIKVGRRRLIPAGAITDFIAAKKGASVADAETPQEVRHVSDDHRRSE